MKCPSCGDEHATADMKRHAERFVTWLAVASHFQLRAESDDPDTNRTIKHIGTVAVLGINLQSLAYVFQTLAQAKLEELASAGKDPVEWLREMVVQLGPHGNSSDILEKVMRSSKSEAN